MRRISTCAPLLTEAQIAAEALGDWRLLASGLHARFKIADFKRGGEFGAAVCTLAEQMNHHREIRLTYGNVDIATVSHDAGSQITVKDIDLARSISELAKAAQLSANASEVTQLEIVLDIVNPCQRWHLDLWLASEIAEAQIAAAVAAGGEVVSTENAPKFTVLAEADGNRARVCVAGL